MLTLVEGGTVVTGINPGETREGWDILIDGGRIAAMGPGLRAGLAGPAETIDARRSIVMPGLINAHLHSNEAFEQGATDALPLELWRLRSYPPFGVAPLTEEDYYLRALMAGIQSIRAGVTTVQDDVINPAATPESVDGVCRAYRELGLRAWVTTSLGDRGLIESHPFLAQMMSAEVRAMLGPDRPKPAAEQMALFERNYETWNGAGGGRIRINLGPRGPQRCTAGLLERIAAASAARGCAVHTHVLETRTQAVTAQLEHGKTLIAYMEDLGLLTPRLTINHGIWLTDADIGLLGEHGCAVTHNPLSNLKIGSGVCRVRALLDAGVAVALGTDGLATSDTADLTAALRVAALIHRTGSPRFAEWVTAHEAFGMATEAGARSGLMADEVGRLAPGRRADLILLDRDHWGFVPLNDPVAQLAFSVPSEAVHTVIVDGSVVMRDRKILTIDEAQVRGAIAEAAERWRRDVKPKAWAAADALFPAMTRMYDEAMHAFATEDWARAYAVHDGSGQGEGGR